jgi:hypothetical protein
MLKAILSSTVFWLLAIPPADAQNLIDGPHSVVFDSVYNRYLVASFNNMQLVAIDQQGDQSTFAELPPPPGAAGGGPASLHVNGSTLYMSRGAEPSGFSIFDLATGERTADPTIPGTSHFGGLTTDTSGYLYVTECGPYLNEGRLYRFDLSDLSCTLFASEGLSGSRDVVFDEVNNRLLVLSMEAWSPIIAISLPDGTLSEFVPSIPPGDLLGMTIDNDGNIYASALTSGVIYAWDSDGINGRVIVETADEGSDAMHLHYNRKDEVLAVPIYFANKVVFYSMTDDDGDNVPAFKDNCPDISNPDQDDADADGVGDSCDEDDDGDGVVDTEDNCPYHPNSLQYDWDGDGVGDECDNCFMAFNPDQVDLNENGLGDVCDPYCCVGRVGDANGDGGIDPSIGDVSAIIDAKFIAETCSGIILCLAEADVNKSAGPLVTCDDITIGDVSMLVDYLFIAGPDVYGPLPECL